MYEEGKKARQRAHTVRAMGVILIFTGLTAVRMGEWSEVLFGVLGAWLGLAVLTSVAKKWIRLGTSLAVSLALAAAVFLSREEGPHSWSKEPMERPAAPEFTEPRDRSAPGT